MFYSGQKVVCIYDGVVPGIEYTEGIWGPGEDLHKDSIYTIREIFEDVNVLEIIVCTLYEVERHKQSQEFGSWGYSIQRFRPLDERKTDISQFTALLNPIKELEKV